MKLSRKFRVRAPLQDNILSLTAIVSLIALTLTAVAFVLWLMIRSGILTYNWTLFDPQTSETAADPDTPSIYDVLRPEDADSAADGDMTGSVVRFSGEFSTLRALLSDLDAPDSYSAVFDTVLHTQTGESRTVVRVFRHGTSYRIERYPAGYTLSGMPAEIYVSDGETVVFTDTAAGEHAQFPVSEAFSMEALAGIPSTGSFNRIPDEQILHASYAELNGEIVYYVQFTTPDALGRALVQEYWISADTEFVMRCRTYSAAGADETPVFSSDLRSTDPLTEQQMQTQFLLPETTAN